MKKFIFFARVYSCLMLVPLTVSGQDTLNIYPNYVVIGAFAIEQNAIQFSEEAIRKRFPAKFEMNPNRNLYYVYVLTTDDRPFAFEEALRLRTDTKYFDTWVYSGPFGEMGLVTNAHANTQDFNPETGARLNTVTSDVEQLQSDRNNINASTAQLRGGETSGLVQGDQLQAGGPEGQENEKGRRKGKSKGDAESGPGSETNGIATGAFLASGEQTSGQTGTDVTRQRSRRNAGKNSRQNVDGTTGQSPNQNISGSGSETSLTGDQSNLQASGVNVEQGTLQSSERNGRKNGPDTQGSPLSDDQTGGQNRFVSDQGQTGNDGKAGLQSAQQTTARNTGQGIGQGTKQANGQAGGGGSENKQANGEAGGETSLVSGQGLSQDQVQNAGRAGVQGAQQATDQKNAQATTQGNQQTTGTAGGVKGQNLAQAQNKPGSQQNGTASDPTGIQGGERTSGNEQTSAQTGKQNDQASGRKTNATSTKNQVTSAQTQGRAGDQSGDNVNGQASDRGEDMLVSGQGGGQRQAQGNSSEEELGSTSGTDAQETAADDSDLPNSRKEIKLGPPPQRATTAPLTKEEVSDKDFYFHLFRGDNLKMIPGDVDAIDFEKSRRMATYEANAPVKVIMPSGKTKQISFVCQVFGYRKHQREFDPNAPAEDLYLDDKGNLVVPFELVRLQKGDIAIMYNVFFFKDAAVMRPESRYEVNNLLDLLVENPAYKIRIHGHTNGNASGKIVRMDQSKNFYSLAGTKQGFGSAKQLSEERANVIREFLISSGIPADRMDVRAWGGKKPIHDKHSVRANENVRVEIEIL